MPRAARGAALTTGAPIVSDWTHDRETPATRHGVAARTGVRVVTNPGGSNERFVRANLPLAQVIVHSDNVTIFDEILDGRADVMISESVEALVQQKAHPGLCAIRPERPLQDGEMACLLPRGDAAFKDWIDTWLHLSKAGGDFDRLVAPWLR